jgi:hypothetical protein
MVYYRIVQKHLDKFSYKGVGQSPNILVNFGLSALPLPLARSIIFLLYNIFLINFINKNARLFSKSCILPHFIGFNGSVEAFFVV